MHVRTRLLTHAHIIHLTLLHQPLLLLLLAHIHIHHLMLLLRLLLHSASVHHPLLHHHSAILIHLLHLLRLLYDHLLRLVTARLVHYNLSLLLRLLLLLRLALARLHIIVSYLLLLLSILLGIYILNALAIGVELAPLLLLLLLLDRLRLHIVHLAHLSSRIDLSIHVVRAVAAVVVHHLRLLLLLGLRLRLLLLHKLLIDGRVDVAELLQNRAALGMRRRLEPIQDIGSGRVDGRVGLARLRSHLLSVLRLRLLLLLLGVLLLSNWESGRTRRRRSVQTGHGRAHTQRRSVGVHLLILLSILLLLLPVVHASIDAASIAAAARIDRVGRGRRGRMRANVGAVHVRVDYLRHARIDDGRVGLSYACIDRSRRRRIGVAARRQVRLLLYDDLLGARRPDHVGHGRSGVGLARAVDQLLLLLNHVIHVVRMLLLLLLLLLGIVGLGVMLRLLLLGRVVHELCVERGRGRGVVVQVDVVHLLVLHVIRLLRLGLLRYMVDLLLLLLLLWLLNGIGLVLLEMRIGQVDVHRWLLYDLGVHLLLLLHNLRLAELFDRLLLLLLDLLSWIAGFKIMDYVK